MIQYSLKQLSSMRLAFILLCAGIVWFGIGMGLADLGGYRSSLKQLNSIALVEWWPIMQLEPVLLLWLSSLVLVFFLLGCSTLACTYTSLIPLWQRRRWRHKQIMLAPIHLLTLLIFVCHGLDVVWVHQPTKIEMQVGDSTQFEGTTITLKHIDYQDDIAAIRADLQGHTAAGRITRRSITQFDPRHNTAEFVVSIQQQNINAQARFLEPYQWQSNKLIVTDFYVPYGQPDSALTAKVTLIHNPLTAFFFGCYLLLLLSLLLHVLHLSLCSKRLED
ncbi:hypothetical protein [Ferrimonas lipolytica]|uniref:ResB-like family protein n=1 Tax=Ferrimonas lipolytica TaxID=2724191 RepID=A0A6H1UKC5_9GAMM|nr:hypothetical protein [Ferrimonas lipolytica]QIZ78676.1 hypothetical protein HER31_18285 [Ferrimonas lipolytica]